MDFHSIIFRDRTDWTGLQWNFWISPTSIGRIINETCIAIRNTLSKHNLVKAPSSEEEWKNIALRFEKKWNFHHCIGAIDGKHINMQAPARSGSFFFSYKKSHSIVLMAVCNADYQFTLIDVGDTRRNSDGGVFANSAIGDALQQNLLNIPLPESISRTTAMFPYVLIGDEAFPLKDYLMKPYPREVLPLKERIFNYRLSRGRRIIENCFGILAARCRIFRKSIVAREEVVINVTKAAVALHNFLMCGREFEPERFRYCPSGFVDHETPEGIQEGRWRRETETY